MAKQIEDVRQRMVQRASDCEVGDCHVWSLATKFRLTGDFFPTFQNGVPIDRLPLDATCYPTAYSMAIDDGQSGGRVDKSATE